jgi:hypothetical protein
VPFYFVAGGSSEEDRKRPRSHGTEEEQEAESAYVRLYAAYKRTRDETLIPQLEEYFRRMSEEARHQYIDGLPCHDNIDPFTLQEINTLEIDNVIYLMEGNIKYCYELDSLVGYIQSTSQRDEYGRRDPRHPVSRKPFTEEEMLRIRGAAQSRVVTLWKKFHTFVDAVLLREVMEKLSVMYASFVPAATFTGAKRTRLEKELQTVHANGLCSYVIQQWPLLRLLDCKVADIQWAQIKKDNLKGLAELFKTKEELRDALKVPSFSDFCNREDDVLLLWLNTFSQEKDLSNVLSRLVAFKRALKPFRRYKLYLYKRLDHNVMEVNNVYPREGESLQDAYNRTFEGVDFERFDVPENMYFNATWFSILAKWDGDREFKEEDEIRQIPWPGDEPESEDPIEWRLVVVIQYTPPHIHVTYEFPKHLREIQPGMHNIDAKDVVYHKFAFVAKYETLWPRNWGKNQYRESYKIGIRYELRFGATRFKYVDTSSMTPWSDIYDQLSEYARDRNHASPSIRPDATWRVDIQVTPDLDEAYAKGLSFLLKKWSHYVERVHLQYSDVYWNKFKLSNLTEAHALANMFKSVEELEIVLFTVSSFGELVARYRDYGGQFWALLENRFCPEVGDESKRNICLTRKIEAVRKKRLQLEHFKTLHFRLFISLVDEAFNAKTYDVTADTPENVRVEYEKMFHLGVYSVLPAMYHTPWLRIWSRWDYKGDSEAREYGSVTFPWPGEYIDPGHRSVITLNVWIKTGPKIVMRVEIPGRERKTLNLDPNQIFYLQQLPEAKRRDFMYRFAWLWPGPQNFFDNPDRLKTYVNFVAKLGEERKDNLLSDHTQRGFVFPVLHESPFGDIMRLIKDVVLAEYKPDQDISYEVIVSVK